MPSGCCHGADRNHQSCSCRSTREGHSECISNSIICPQEADVCQARPLEAKLSRWDQERAHAIANRIRKIGMVEKDRQFVYVFEQTGRTTDELGKNFHMHARFYVKGKDTDVSPGKVAKEVWRITKLDKNSTHIVFHDNIHKLTSYMAGHKNFEEYPDKKSKCEMDVGWRLEARVLPAEHPSLTMQLLFPYDSITACA